MIFLDTNILLRYLTWDNPEKAKRCDALFKKTAEGKESLYTTTLVIAEVVWTLEKAYKLSRDKIASCIQKILNTPNINLAEKDLLFSVITLYNLKGIDFIDAYNAVVMETNKISTIYSYDAHFDLLSSLKRLEP